MIDVSSVRARLTGPVFTPDDPGFADEVFAWNSAITHHPDVAIGVETAHDVVEAVRFAHHEELPLAVQATGHGAHAPITSGVMIITRRLDTVAIDVASRTATIGAGVKWRQVVTAAAEYGLAPITGSSGMVGVVGYLAGGGLGPLARSHGFSSDWVRGYQVVTGAGELVRATASEHPDLFWALRGGKTGLGIVTEVTIELAELPVIYGGNLTWDAPHIETVLRDWVDFTRDAPDEVTTSVIVVRMPALDEVPEPIRGKTLLTLRFAFPGTTQVGAAIAQRFRDIAPVLIDRLGPLPAVEIERVHDDPTDPGPSWATGSLLRDIDQDFVTAVLRRVGPGVDTALMVVELRHIGGATRDDVAGGSAASGRAATHTLGLIAGLPPHLPVAAVEADARQLLADVHPWLSPQSNPNFANTLATPAEAASGWPEGTLERLREVREVYDPEGVFAVVGTS